MQKTTQAYTRLISNVIKLVSVLATFMSMTGASEEALVHILCIHYLV